MADTSVLQGDARQMRELGIKPDSVDCFITSPPYFNLKRYNEEAPEELGQGQDLDGYLSDLQAILADCLALASQTGVLWLILDTFREPARKGGLGELVPLPFRIADVARAAGWRFQEVVIWEKNKTLPYSGQGKLRNLIEYVLLFTKGQEFKHRPFRLAEAHGTQAEWLAGWPERYHPLGKRPANVWKIPIPTQGMWAHSERLHFCPFPQELVAHCIELTTDKGDTVLDPFSGIGTVPAQAAAMGRHGMGVELNPAFIDLFRTQILPTFQAEWESDAEKREMGRKDQIREAETIFLLRSLKAGKELAKLVGRRSNERPHGDLAAAVESIYVEVPSAFSEYFDAVEGSVGRPPTELIAVADLGGDEAEKLREEIEAEMTKPPFSTFGLELSCTVMGRDALSRRVDGQGLHEFEQSRRASFTQRIDSPDFQKPLPRLITNGTLGRVVHGDRSSPLEMARKEAERRLLESEFAQSSDSEELATRLGIPEAELRRLLIEHGITAEEKTFGIPLSPAGDA